MVLKRLFRKYSNEIKIVGIASIMALLFCFYTYSHKRIASDTKGTALSTNSVREKKVYPTSTITPSSTPTLSLQVAPTIIQINIYVTNTSPIYNQIYTTISNEATPTTIQPTSIPSSTIMPTATSTPTPTTAPLLSSFTGKYFNNSTFTGSPVLTRTDSSINFDWVKSSPDASITVDSFSATWEGTINATEGTYQIITKHDDGMRIYIDSGMVYNQWSSQTAWKFSTLNLTPGSHSLKIEYYEGSGNALAYFDLRKL